MSVHAGLDRLSTWIAKPITPTIVTMNPYMPSTSLNNASSPMMPQNNSSAANNFSMNPYIQAMAAFQQPQMNSQMVQMMLSMMGNPGTQAAPYMFGGMPPAAQIQIPLMNGFPMQPPEGNKKQMLAVPSTSTPPMMPSTSNDQPSVPSMTNLAFSAAALMASTPQQESQTRQTVSLDDSGNETSSISPQSASTVETPSNSGLPSRSGSFSATNKSMATVRRSVESAPVNPSAPKRRKIDPMNQVPQFPQMGQLPQTPFFAQQMQQMMMNPAYMGQNFNMMNSMGMSPMGMNSMDMNLHYANALSKEDSCVICGDKSSGYHYQALSCEGCKGFFRRAVQQKLSYTCYKDEQCEVNKDTRTRCQKCRLQKCFDEGMKPELVHTKSKKAKKDDEANQNALRLCNQLTKMIGTAFNASFGNLVDEVKKGDKPAFFDADMDDFKRMATKFVSKFTEVSVEEREKLVAPSLRALLAVLGAYCISQRSELASAAVFKLLPTTIADMIEVKNLLDFDDMTADTLSIVAAMTFTIMTPNISTEAREAITKLHERFTLSYSFMNKDALNSSGAPVIYSFTNSMRKFF